MTRIARLVPRVLLALALASGASACVGTDAPRKAGARPAVKSQRPPNPNADLVRPPKERRELRPAGPAIALPANSWFDHDREVHAAIPKEQAQGAARVYPWFEVPTYVSSGAKIKTGAEGDDGGQDE